MNARRSLLGLVRSLHIYLSSLAIALFLFVAVTGFLLNHATRFGLDEARAQTQTLTLPTGALTQPDKTALVQELRQRLGRVGELNTFEAEADELRITFKKPGSRTDVVVDRATGQTEVTTESRGVLGVMADLHKGASAGNGWSYVIDAAAILLAFVSLTGLVLLFSLPRRRWLATSLVAVGIGAGLLVYTLFAI